MIQDGHPVDASRARIALLRDEMVAADDVKQGLP